MSDQSLEYRVLVSGNVLEGQDRESVIDAFASLLKLDGAKAASYFEGKPRIIKKQTDQATAKKFLSAFERIGVDASMEPLEPVVEAGAGLSLAPEPGLDSTPEEEKPAAAGLSMAPEPGMDAAAKAEKPAAAAAGSTMMCPGCNTLQPKAEQCPSCGVFVDKVRQAQDAQRAQAEEAGETYTPSASPGEDKLGMGSIAAAGVTALLGALAWMGIALSLEYEFGLVAWLIGGAVGFASAVTGSRGSTAGAMCAVMVLCSILGGKFLFYSSIQSNISEIMAGENFWTGEDAQYWFEEYKYDAELYMDVDGSEESLREFMFERDYTEAYYVEDITSEDIEYFLENDAPDLEWIARESPGLEAWSQRMSASFEAEVANISTMDLVFEDLGLLDLLFLFLGLSTAYRLGDAGISR